MMVQFATSLEVLHCSLAVGEALNTRRFDIVLEAAR